MKQYRAQITISECYIWDVPTLINAESEDEAIAIVATEYNVPKECLTVWKV